MARARSTRSTAWGASPTRRPARATATTSGIDSGSPVSRRVVIVDLACVCLVKRLQLKPDVALLTKDEGRMTKAVRRWAFVLRQGCVSRARDRTVARREFAALACCLRSITRGWAEGN